MGGVRQRNEGCAFVASILFWFWPSSMLTVGAQREGRQHPQLSRKLKFINKSYKLLDLYFVDPDTMNVDLVQEDIKDGVKLNLDTYVGQHFAVQTVDCRHRWDQPNKQHDEKEGNWSDCNLHYFFSSEGQNQGMLELTEYSPCTITTSPCLSLSLALALCLFISRIHGFMPQ